MTKTKSVIIILAVAVSLSTLFAGCGMPENYKYSPSVVKGVWVCEDKEIFYDYSNGSKGTIVVNDESVECICGFDINSNSFHIFTGDIIAEPGVIDLSAAGETYYFTCEFHDGYFIATPDKDYDIFRKGEELRFNHVDTPYS